MKKERITVEEIYSNAWQKGMASLDEVDMIILETTGDITFIEKAIGGKKLTFEDVKVAT